MKLEHIFHLLYLISIPTKVFNFLWAQDKWNCGSEKKITEFSDYSEALRLSFPRSCTESYTWPKRMFYVDFITLLLNIFNNTAFQRWPLLSSLNLAVEGKTCIMDWKVVRGASEELCYQWFSLSLLFPLLAHFHTYHRHLAKHCITALPTLRHPMTSVLSPSRCLRSWLQAPRWATIYLILKLFHILAPLYLCLKTPL